MGMFEKNILIRYIREEAENIIDDAQIFIDQEATTIPEQFPGLDPIDDELNLFTEVSKDAEALETDDISRRNEGYLWAWNGLRLDFRWFGVKRNAYFGGTKPGFYDHGVQIYFADEHSIDDLSVFSSGASINSWISSNPNNLIWSVTGENDYPHYIEGKHHKFMSGYVSTESDYFGSQWYSKKSRMKEDNTAAENPIVYHDFDSMKEYVQDQPQNSAGNVGPHITGLFNDPPELVNSTRDSVVAFDSAGLNQGKTDFLEEVKKTSAESENYYIIVKLMGDAEEAGFQNRDILDYSYYTMKFPKSTLKRLIEDPEIEYLNLSWGGGFPGPETAEDGGYYDGTGALIDSTVDWSPGALSMKTDGRGTEESEGRISAFGKTVWVGDDKTPPAFKLQGLGIRLYAPQHSTAYDSFLDSNFAPFSGVEGLETFPVWARPDHDMAGNTFHIKTWQPGNFVDYLTLTKFGYGMEGYLRSKLFPVWRPISHAYIQDPRAEDNFLSFQRRYESESIENMYVGSPTTVNLSFDISDSHSRSNVVDLDVNGKWNPPDFPSGLDLGFKWFVVRWGDEDDSFDFSTDGWEGLANNVIADMNSFKADGNTYDTFTDDGDKYRYMDVFSSDGVGVLSHNYTEPGIKDIYTVVVSYVTIDDGTNDWMMALSWKLVKVRFEISPAQYKAVDFPTLGGTNFKVIPWNFPMRTPILGGISKDSRYVKSIDSTLDAGKFKIPEDAIDLSLLREAKNNSELGDHVGKADLEQARAFLGSRDLHELLMIHPTRDPSVDWAPYTDTSYWDGETNVFPVESCVGSMKIYKNDNKDLVSDCVFEFNLGTLEVSSYVIDSSGNGNIGFLIGDFAVKKKKKTIRMARDSSIKRPKVGTAKPAL